MSGDSRDERLGLNEPITRRDFVHGTLAAGAGAMLGGRASFALPAEDEWTGYGGIGDYRTSNGNTYEVMTAGHAMRDGAFEKALAGAADTGETYDLAVVGGGISGLAAAVFFRSRGGGRCLVLDDHPIFGGEAKRNRFRVDGRVVTAHQGSAMFPVPRRGGYVDRVYEMIGMDRPALEYARWAALAPDAAAAHALRAGRRAVAVLRLLLRPGLRERAGGVGDRPLGPGSWRARPSATSNGRSCCAGARWTRPARGHGGRATRSRGGSTGSPSRSS